VGAKNFAQISPKLATFHVIFGAIFIKSKQVRCHFCWYFMEFAQIFRDFLNVFTNFAQIFTDFPGFCPHFHQIKTFGGELAPPEPPPPAPLMGTVRGAHLFYSSVTTKTIFER